jgi:hypothetical protein
MPFASCDHTTTEHDFALHVQSVLAVADARTAREELVALLRESHAAYRDRAAPVIAQMRAWVMLAIERVGVTDSELTYVLEELDKGPDAYLVAAAARALRTYPKPHSLFDPIVYRAIERIRCCDESLTLRQYSGYALSARATTATRELRATQQWLRARTTARRTDRGDSDQTPAGSSRGDSPGERPTAGGVGGSVASAALTTVASLAAAFFPKCVMCWGAYLSIFGIAGLERVPYAPWLLPLFIALMSVNIASLWPGQHGNVAAFALAVAGAQVILVLGIGCEVPGAAPLGLALSTAGSFLGVKSRSAQQRQPASSLGFAPIAAADPRR